MPEASTHPGLFITASDTGAGKTYLTAALARHFRRHGWPVAVCKPVATGAEWWQGRWLGEDTRLLAEAAGQDPDAVTAWTFPLAAAPPVAARHAGTALELARVVEAVRGRQMPGVPLLVEGIGGLLCPLTARESVADLAAALGLPVLVATSRGLGTLNHTLLTLEVARRRGLHLAGVVMTETHPVQGVAEETNPEELRTRIDVPLLAVLPHRPGPAGADLPELEGVDWRALPG
jgi:dethiobiotin synthetase